MKKTYRIPNIYLVLMVIIPLSWLINKPLLWELGLVLVGYLVILLINQVWLQVKYHQLYNEHQQVSKMISQVHTYR